MTPILPLRGDRCDRCDRCDHRDRNTAGARDVRRHQGLQPKTRDLRAQRPD